MSGALSFSSGFSNLSSALLGRILAALKLESIWAFRCLPPAPRTLFVKSRVPSAFIRTSASGRPRCTVSCSLPSVPRRSKNLSHLPGAPSSSSALDSDESDTSWQSRSVPLAFAQVPHSFWTCYCRILTKNGWLLFAYKNIAPFYTLSGVQFRGPSPARSGVIPRYLPHG